MCIQHVLEYCVYRAGSVELRNCTEDWEAARVKRLDIGHGMSRAYTKNYS